MKEPEYEDIGFTHWECCRENAEAECMALEPSLKIHAVLRPGTTVKIGLFIQHKICLSSKKGIILSCVAEQVFISDDIPGYSCAGIKELLQTAHRNFNDKLFAKSKEENIPLTIDCTVNDFEVEQVLQQLK